jgi:uncharacterized protein with HEPN domain
MKRDLHVYVADVLIHGYFGVKLERIWRVIEEDLPELKGKMTLLHEDLT